MTLIEKLQAKKKVTRHWLHCLGVVFTFGTWLPFYIMIVAFRAIHNRDIDSQIGGAALAMSSHIYAENEKNAADKARAEFDAGERL